MPGGRAGSVFWNGLGFLTTVVAIVLALIPPADTADKTGFFVQVFIGSFGFLFAGLILYAMAERRGAGRRSRRRIAPSGSSFLTPRQTILLVGEDGDARRGHRDGA